MMKVVCIVELIIKYYQTRMKSLLLACCRFLNKPAGNKCRNAHTQEEIKEAEAKRRARNEAIAMSETDY